MNTKILFILAGIATVVAGCSPPGVVGDGTLKIEERTVTDFSKLEATGGYLIQWSAGKPSLSITGDENLLPLIKTEVNGDTLQIESSERITTSKGIKIMVTSPALAEVNLTGGNTFTASQLSGKSLKLESTGASDMNVDGSVTNLEATLTGAGRLKAKSLPTANATLSLVGAGQAEVTVTDNLKVSIIGAGSVTYAGHPKSVEKSVVGAGTIHEQP